jgi:hypothetical protein
MEEVRSNQYGERRTSTTTLDDVLNNYRRTRRFSEKRKLFAFAHLIVFLERACDDLEDEEDRERIPQSVTPEMLIDAKQRMTLAAERLAAFATRIDEKLNACHLLSAIDRFKAKEVA